MACSNAVMQMNRLFYCFNNVLHMRAVSKRTGIFHTYAACAGEMSSYFNLLLRKKMDVFPLNDKFVAD